jgi:hypothetical protein
LTFVVRTKYCAQKNILGQAWRPCTLRCYFWGSYKDGNKFKGFYGAIPCPPQCWQKCSCELSKTILCILLTEIAGIGERGSLWRPLPNA